MRRMQYRLPAIVALMVLSITYTSLGAAVLPLGPENSFNGNGKISYSYDVQPDDVYNLAGDVSISNVDNSSVNKACFDVTSGSMTFLGNEHRLYCRNIKSGTTLEGVVLSSKGTQATVRFSGFSLLSFIESPSDIGEQGCFYVKNALMLLNNNLIRFEKNRSKTKGGAINAGNVTLAGNYNSVMFYDNEAVSSGGAIHASGSIQIMVNQGAVSFLQNNAKNGLGGALYSNGDIDISQNTHVIFRDNQALTTDIGQGGAICCLPQSGSSAPVPVLTLSGNKGVIFERNRSIIGGGAIYARRLTISSGGPTLFINNIVDMNSTNLGGAITIDSGGELILTAEQGNITFQGNHTSNNTLNALHLRSNAKFLKLQARDGFSVEFYDPITSEADGSTNLNINGDPKNKVYTGSILFSGAKSISKDIKNFQSVIPQNVNLSAGSLVLKGGADLTVSKFTQSPESRLIMDLGTRLQASKEDITITKLAINIDTLTSSSIPAVIKANKQISITSPIELITAGIVYDNVGMRNDQNFSLLVLEPGTGAAVTVLNSISENPHFGFQGSWKLAWSGTGRQVGELAWHKTGYRPSPEKEGNLVSNILWGNFIDIKSLMHIQESYGWSLQTDRSICIDGIGNFFHLSASEKNKRYRHNSAGYVLSINNELTPTHYTSLAFSQIFSRDKDYAVSKNEYRMYLGSYLCQYTTSLNTIFHYVARSHNLKVGIPIRRVPQNPPLIFQFLCTYGHVCNHMKTDYTDIPMVRNSWRNNCCAMNCGASMPLLLFENGRVFQAAIPFMKLQLVYAYQRSFKETITNGRRFSRGSLTCISLPLGVRFEKLAPSENLLYDFSFSYVPDLFRNNPSCEGGLVISRDSWLTSATNLSKHAFVGRGMSRYNFNDYTEFFCEGGVEWRPHSRNYNINCGSKFRF
ncbi:Polymorphic membrane protein F,chlamydial polymorphic outer membrane protein repeat,Autotransporter beta-domain [Chlamydia serpentis]|uniref:Polymorphic membrane protein F,chlamydial polymorphic outer membrane protein repeat,Autotransporter beta-domain n=1 Tax=Chlamydia serpentis TaxID=1967782 RepID=A0A2R8FA69_9CHLA|nr:polymorphic outer membrane protein middle domain-containing protein [Chlamydia serpentis]SPN73196.1 Polymorphic membrane protein F,chlamydial polymorphic outer membrane protein repeat,Autotransporter beta-domain [Chlamydia serpentis]